MNSTPVSGSGQVWRLAALALAAGLSAGCIEPLAPGEFGNFRFFGAVRSDTGQPPLPLLPPYTDREGNIYILEGDPNEAARTQAVTAMPKGGWNFGDHCGTPRGDSYGAHGWVGHSDDTAWYWSGDSLVSVSGRRGTCNEVVSGRDRRTGTMINLKGVFPWVKNTPTRSTIVALVQSSSDAAPFSAVVDLPNDLFLSVQPFQPSEARAVIILGVGANRETEEGYLLVRYRLGDQDFVEGRVVDSQGQTLSVTALEGGADLEQYSIQGFLQPSGSGLVAGLDNQGRMVFFDANQGGFRSVTEMVAHGVHAWDGKLYVVGTNLAGDAPVLAEIDGAGNLGPPVVWEASVKAVEALKDGISVENDRTSPRRLETWSHPANAIGPFPFVHPHSPNRYAAGETGWVVAGPSYVSSGVQMMSVAFTAVGISYP